MKRKSQNNNSNLISIICHLTECHPRAMVALKDTHHIKDILLPGLKVAKATHRDHGAGCHPKVWRFVIGPNILLPMARNIITTPSRENLFGKSLKNLQISNVDKLRVEGRPGARYNPQFKPSLYLWSPRKNSPNPKLLQKYK